MNRVEGVPLKDAYRTEQDYTARLLGFEDAAEARRAFLDKRPPNGSGVKLAVGMVAGKPGEHRVEPPIVDSSTEERMHSKQGMRGRCIRVEVVDEAVDVVQLGDLAGRRARQRANISVALRWRSAGTVG